MTDIKDKASHIIALCDRLNAGNASHMAALIGGYARGILEAEAKMVDIDNAREWLGEHAEDYYEEGLLGVYCDVGRLVEDFLKAMKEDEE